MTLWPDLTAASRRGVLTERQQKLAELFDDTDADGQFRLIELLDAIIEKGPIVAFNIEGAAI